MQQTPDPAFPSDFLALECNPCFRLRVVEDVGRDSSPADGPPESPDDVRRQAYETVRSARRQLTDTLMDAVKFGRLLYRVRESEPVDADIIALWAETRGYIERQDGDTSAPLLDHIGRVVALLARAERATAKSPPITAIDVMQFEEVMRIVVTMVEVAAGAMEDETGDWGTH